MWSHGLIRIIKGRIVIMDIPCGKSNVAGANHPNVWVLIVLIYFNFQNHLLYINMVFFFLLLCVFLSQWYPRRTSISDSAWVLSQHLEPFRYNYFIDDGDPIMKRWWIFFSGDISMVYRVYCLRSSLNTCFCTHHHFSIRELIEIQSCAEAAHDERTMAKVSRCD